MRISHIKSRASIVEILSQIGLFVNAGMLGWGLRSGRECPRPGARGAKADRGHDPAHQVAQPERDSVCGQQGQSNLYSFESQNYGILRTVTEVITEDQWEGCKK